MIALLNLSNVFGPNSQFLSTSHLYMGLMMFLTVIMTLLLINWSHVSQTKPDRSLIVAYFVIVIGLSFAVIYAMIMAYVTS